MTCGNCGTQNEPGRKFCRECGSALARPCPVCGATNDGAAKFCGECGAALGGSAPIVPTSSPVAERRMVSVLFVDLVGFTAASEDRDSEETRELLGRYFDVASRLIARYGGTIEKFIGDAVMAVWGAPIAREDDAERAVRAALDLTSGVAELGGEAGIPDLRARAGVLTGEAAVTLGAEGQGMVAGDLVNTASRLQSIAPPGAVFVGDGTRRASEAAVAYEDAGVHELKGKAEPVHAWQAMRVLAGRGGALKSHGLEAPFVGRDRELRLVKDLFHASGEEGKAHLVSIVGVAGIGKSRLAWEFFKYLDGLLDTAYWHRGRCLPYGDGVAFWALAEIVRMRAQIQEEEEPAVAAAKLRGTVDEHVEAPDEREWVYGRLAHLLGLEDRPAGDPDDLFAAWRLFFERLSATYPVVLVFEDIQWADAGLLDFIEYLLDWSRNHPLYVVTLSRPELMERRPGWGAGRRGATSLFLEPLSNADMERLVAGLVPGLPDDVRLRIRDRAEGVPLYAVETVRMLLDRGLLRLDGSRYVVTGSVEDLAVPESLQALIAARLDGLPPEERALLQDAAVLGKTFTPAGLVAVSGRTEPDLQPLLSSLVRKEVLGLQSDPRSPDRGQYGFLQSLVRKVAYDTLSKRDRKARHLAVAGHLEASWGPDDDEIVQVVAAHYLDAYLAAPADPDAAEIKEKARETLIRAARRAESLAAHEEAFRYFDRAIEVTEDEVQRARLLERAGMEAVVAGHVDEPVDRYRQAIELFESNGLTHPAARVSGRLGVFEWWQLDRGQEAVERMERSFQILSKEEPDADVVALANDLGRLYYFLGHPDLALERIEFALPYAEALPLPEVLSHALNTKGLILSSARRTHEADALLKKALEVALEHDQFNAAIRAYTNLSVMAGPWTDRYEEGLALERAGVALASRVGERGNMWFLTAHMVAMYWCLGDWDEAIAAADQIPDPEEFTDAKPAAEVSEWVRMFILVDRGENEAALGRMKVYEGLEDTADIQQLTLLAGVRALAERAAGNHREALRLTMDMIEHGDARYEGHPNMRQLFIEAVKAAVETRDRAALEFLVVKLAAIGPGVRAPMLTGLMAMARAQVAWWDGDPAMGARESLAAEAVYREIGNPFWLAVTLLERAEALAPLGEDPEAPLAEARAIFARLKANPWLDRVSALRMPTAPAEAAR